MKGILLFGAWLVFVALLLQLAGWAYVSMGSVKAIEGYGYPAGLFVPHPQLGYIYRAGFSGLFNGPGYREIPININSQGFRDQSFASTPADRARIAFLGDSVVFGAGVRAEDRFTECLESADPVAAPGSRPPVILNLGVNAYSFGHYLSLAELDFFGLKPSAVVVGVTLNDFAEMETSAPAREMRRHAEGAHTPNWVARVKDRVGGTYAARFLSELSTRLRYALMNADKREQYHTKWMRSVVRAWEQPEVRARFFADLDRFAALTEAAQVPFGFVLFPELNDVTDPDGFSGPRRTALQLLQAHDLAVCDLYTDFARQPDPTRLFLPYDSVHYSPAGHRLVCAQVRRCLADWGFLSP